MSLRETAYAKLNLALHIRRRRGDGYHDLESLFAFANFGDVLTFAPADDVALEIGGPFAADLASGDDNLVIRAAKLLQTTAKVTAGAAIHLEKNLPVASGIGGGSADAAATLRGLDRLWGLGLGTHALADLGATLGADVPACVHSHLCRGEGIGERLDMIGGAELTGRAVLLVNPGKPLATAAVFAAWDGIDNGPLADADPLAASIAGVNGLEAAACAICPDIATVLSDVRACAGAELVRMSGSGATCFALFRSGRSADEARRTIAGRRPGWWIAAGKLR